MISTLTTLADRYENEGFLNGDPSWFMHQVKGERNQETMAFIASSLSFGSRQQFMPKIQYILDCSHGEVYQWVKDGCFNTDIPPTKDCFYRLYTYEEMNRFLRVLQDIIMEWGSLKRFVAPDGTEGLLSAIDVLERITGFFCAHGIQGLIPKNTQSSCKRVCMFLRWMVRDGSPVDLGIWSDIIDKRTLIIPLDTHVLQQARHFGIIAAKTGSMATAKKISEKMRSVFPDDPMKGDFALFGLGVNSKL